MKTLLMGGLLSTLWIMALSWISAESSPALALPRSSLSKQVQADSRDLSEYVLLHLTSDARMPLQVKTPANACRGSADGVRL